MDVTKINDMERTAMSLSLIESCKYGTADCLTKASEKFTAFDTTTGANELDRDQKLAGYCYGIQEGTVEQWDALWKSDLGKLSPESRPSPESGSRQGPGLLQSPE